MSEASRNSSLLSFGGHLGVLRRMLLRVIGMALIMAMLVFYFKEETFSIILAPHNSDFITFRLTELWMRHLGFEFHFPQYDVTLINTDLSAQFMAHITVSCLLGILLASPYILFELFKFVSPALYEREKKYSYLVAGIVYLLFIIGVLISYYVLFPISFQFLATYQVDEQIVNTITLDSYISTFTTLTFMMGIVFQLPVIAFVLGKIGVIEAAMLKRYREYALVLIMITAAIITPPDLFSLVLITVPIYSLYELSILVLSKQV